MKARTALYSLVLSIAVIGGVFVFGNSSAHAAINGENGPIIYIENNSTEPQENDAINNNELNQILTTDSSGDNEKSQLNQKIQLPQPEYRRLLRRTTMILHMLPKQIILMFAKTMNIPALL